MHLDTDNFIIKLKYFMIMITLSKKSGQLKGLKLQEMKVTKTFFSTIWFSVLIYRFLHLGLHG